jgi:lipid-A-disaccharide synthase
MKFLIKIKNIAIANIILGKTVIKELIQKDVNCDKIVNETEVILKNENVYLQLKTELSVLQKILGEEKASAGAAKIIIKEISDAKAA